nr:MAG TPA: hypothetical protein [Caudoviricetes sp.]
MMQMSGSPGIFSSRSFLKFIFHLSTIIDFYRVRLT